MLDFIHGIVVRYFFEATEIELALQVFMCVFNIYIFNTIKPALSPKMATFLFGLNGILCCIQLFAPSIALAYVLSISSLLLLCFLAFALYSHFSQIKASSL